MDYNSIWKNADWTKEARLLLHGLNHFPKDSKITLIIRHSHRNSIRTLSDMAGIRLTPLGHIIAKIFGSKLPRERSIRLFHSPIQRCRETAEDILEGLNRVSKKGILKDPLDELYDIGVNADFLFNETQKYPEMQFLNRWAADLYKPENVTPFDEYCQNAAKIIWDNNKDIEDANIDIYVSHDLIILTYRLGWFGLSPNWKWPSFLGGFAFIINDSEILLLEDGKIITVENPYWWNAKKR